MHFTFRTFGVSAFCFLVCIPGRYQASGGVWAQSGPFATVEVYFYDGTKVVCEECQFDDSRRPGEEMVILPGASANSYIAVRQFREFRAYAASAQASTSHIRGDLFLADGTTIRDCQISAHRLRGQIFGAQTEYWLANEVVTKVERITYRW